MSHVCTRERHENKNTRFWATYGKYRKIKPTEGSHVQIQSEIETQILTS